MNCRGESVAAGQETCPAYFHALPHSRAMDRAVPFRPSRSPFLIRVNSCPFVAPMGFLHAPGGNSPQTEEETIEATNGHEFTRIRKAEGSRQVTWGGFHTGTVKPHPRLASGLPA